MEPFGKGRIDFTTDVPLAVSAGLLWTVTTKEWRKKTATSRLRIRPSFTLMVDATKDVSSPGMNTPQDAGPAKVPLT